MEAIEGQWSHLSMGGKRGEGICYPFIQRAHLTSSHPNPSKYHNAPKCTIFWKRADRVRVRLLCVRVHVCSRVCVQAGRSGSGCRVCSRFPVGCAGVLHCVRSLCTVADLRDDCGTWDATGIVGY